jgi:nucleotide-binding universal stress UspA family protein
MTIICGTDLSPASAGALDVARALAGLRGDSELVLLHVADTAGNEVVRDEALEQARAQLDKLVAERPGTPTIRTELTTADSPHEALVGFAEAEGADLIVVAHRSTNLKEKRLGTTAHRVIAHAQMPVIAVRDPAPWLAFAKRERPLKVLLGIDDSAVCDLGIQWTHALREKGPVDVVLGAVYYPDDAASHYGLVSKTMVDRDPAIEELMTRDLLRRFGAEGHGIVARPKRGLGRIGDHVVELANEETVDVIVVGTGQKTGLGRLGSVSSVIVADAAQSVVCVPPQASIPTIVVPRLRSAMVATDLSQFANRAVAYAFAQASDEVHIVHVIKDDAEANEIELARTLVALAPVGARQKVTPHVVRGDDAAITLARCAARHGVDVICISSHGRSGIARALVGSVADQLLRATRLPVLVLRPA